MVCTKWLFSWHHGNISRVDCQTKLEKAFKESVKVSGRPLNSWLVRLSRNNEQTISVCFNKKKPKDEVKGKRTCDNFLGLRFALCDLKELRLD